jgi:hypothetical protein
MVVVCENCALQFFEALVHKFERAPGVFQRHKEECDSPNIDRFDTFSPSHYPRKAHILESPISSDLVY